MAASGSVASITKKALESFFQIKNLLLNNIEQGCMQLKDILTLQRVQGIGDKSLVALIQYCNAKGINSLAELDLHDVSEASGLKRVSSLIQRFLSERLYEETLREVENKLVEWKSQSIAAVTYGSERYPGLLAELSDPPAILYCRGNLDLLKASKSIAVVGTRKNTVLGEAITRKTVRYFSQKGFCIVSGLALGIDAIAHSEALEAQGRTIAVVVDVVNISPSNNRQLANQIIAADGLLLSENPPDTKVIPALFVKRDRIQSGLSLAVFAIETSVDGGTMHAVKAAHGLNRQVYVPDPNAARYPDLTEQAISGTQHLLKEGSAQAYSRLSYEKITQELEAAVSVTADGPNNPGGLL
ncbi:MAG: DNA-protecting protein DprA [Alcanivoracaceae bacterium]|nr:DNA-protecting protein DprA [Alcanivoracaceae bacterium]